MRALYIAVMRHKPFRVMKPADFQCFSWVYRFIIAVSLEDAKMPKRGSSRCARATVIKGHYARALEHEEGS